MYKQGCNADGVVLRDVYVVHDPVDLYFPDDGMTRQEFADECDINVLMANYEKHGTLPPLSRNAPEYLDVTDVPDLHKAMSIIGAAEAAFMTLPAHIRREFDNSAVKFVEYAENPENLGKMREWGLAPPAEAVEAPVAPPPSPESP